MQSRNNYRAQDLLAQVYTVPWWFDSIGGKYLTAFISDLIPPARVAQHLRYLGPKILSLYPSSLQALMPHVDEFRSSLNLALRIRNTRRVPPVSNATAARRARPRRMLL
jgi:phenylacetate-CoA ligase